jgi:hypothetical protein
LAGAGGVGLGDGLADPLSPRELSVAALLSAGAAGASWGGVAGAAAAAPGPALSPGTGAGRAVGRELQIHTPNAAAAAPAARIVPRRRPPSAIA